MSQALTSSEAASAADACRAEAKREEGLALVAQSHVDDEMQEHHLSEAEGWHRLATKLRDMSRDGRS